METPVPTSQSAGNDGERLSQLSDGIERGGESPVKSERPALLPGKGSDPCAVLADNRHVRADARMVERAIRNRWPISNSRRRKLIDRLSSIVEYGEDDKAIGAARALIACDSINVTAGKPAPVRQSLTVNVGAQSALTDEQRAILVAADKLLDTLPTALPAPTKE